ncbi:MAG: ATP-binding protein [Bacillota bacterium]
MNKQFQEAFNIVKSRRVANELARKTTMTTLRGDDEFKNIESERDTLGFEIARLMSLNADVGSLNKQYDALNAKLIARVKQLGYTENDLQNHYVCERCKDIGMVGGENCTCVKQLVFDMLSGNCVGRVTDIDNYDAIDMNFYPAEYRSDMQKRLKWFKKYSASFPNNEYKYLVLSGKVGTGKSFTLSVLANELMRKGLSVLMLNSQQINRIFLKYHLAPVEQKEDIFAPLVDCDLLIIDDLGTENIMNNVTVNYLYELIASRDQSPIAVTTNLGSEQILARYGQRIYSRLFQRGKCLAINFDGVDLRMQ